uniref:Photolyase/cryptochrome alpha/beta domain-containing protein n=1 Tax=Rhizophora mucronata TaxID=61149 RepID=A0A2P2L6C2_RHIMU
MLFFLCVSGGTKRSAKKKEIKSNAFGNKPPHKKMDLNLHAQNTPESKPSFREEEERQQSAIVPSKSIRSSPLATASLSLSLSAILPTVTNLLSQPKVSVLFSSRAPSKVKITTQAASLTHLSLSTTAPTAALAPPKSTISASPLQTPLSLGPRRSSDPSNGAAIRRASIVWFRNDLRVHDNECLTAANNESISVLPVYCFDPRDYGKSSSGFDKTGPYRANFLIQSVSDLRKNLQARGSDLVVRVGQPETVLVQLAKAIGADAVYAQSEVTRDEVKSEEKIEAALKDEGVEVKDFWGSTLYHIDDLPFTLNDMPSNYGEFREKVKGVEIRKTIAALDQLKALPSRGDVEPGEIPSLLDLGLNAPQDDKLAANASTVGGETEALERLKKFVAECQAQPPKATNGSPDGINGANFSCKISPWLTMGCISPRSMLDELKKTATSGGGRSPDTGMNWLVCELLWRDFFRFITKKYSSPVKQLEATPATACTGAFA